MRTPNEAISVGTCAIGRPGPVICIDLLAGIGSLGVAAGKIDAGEHLSVPRNHRFAFHRCGHAKADAEISAHVHAPAGPTRIR